MMAYVDLYQYYAGNDSSLAWLTRVTAVVWLQQSTLDTAHNSVVDEAISSCKYQ